MSNILVSVIKEDKEIISLWKRDTEKVIQLLEKRKKELPYGQWRKYLDGIGLPKSTAYRLLNPISDITEDVPNGTTGISTNAGAPATSDEFFGHVDFPAIDTSGGNLEEGGGDDIPAPSKISDLKIGTMEPPKPASIRKQEIEDVPYQELPREKEIKGLPDGYYLICEALDQPDIKGWLIDKKAEYEKQYSNTFPEWKQCLDLYFDFFKDQTGEKPKMMPRNYKDLKSIIIYLRGLGEGDAVANWEAILTNWDKLDDFQKDRIDVSSINLDMNKIIKKLKGNKNPMDTPEMREYLEL